MNSIIQANPGFSILENVYMGREVISIQRVPVIAWAVTMNDGPGRGMQSFPVAADSEPHRTDLEFAPSIEFPDGTVVSGDGSYFSSIDEYKDVGLGIS